MGRGYDLRAWPPHSFRLASNNAHYGTMSSALKRLKNYFINLIMRYDWSVDSCKGKGQHGQACLGQTWCLILSCCCCIG